MGTLRALRVRAGQSLALFATAVSVFAGSVVAVAYSRATSGTGGSAAPLLLIGVVALAAQGAASVRVRRFEIALAQLRGCYGSRLLRAAVTEPMLILLVGAGVGTVVGWLVARFAVHRWVDQTTALQMTTTEWGTVVVVLGISIAVVIAVSWRTTYQPLPDKLGGVERPVAATVTATFLGLLVLLGAAVSVYQARALGVRHADWVSFLSPALLGLAAGQTGVWVVSLLARTALSVASLNRGLGWFVTLRRLTRSADTLGLMRVVVASVAVAGVAGSAWVGADAWREETARMRVGGPVSYLVPDGALQAYAASHTADPDGRWLMAMSAKPDPSGGSYRDILVDSPRWDHVVGPFFTGTPLAPLGGRLAGLPSARPPVITSGAKFTVTFTARSARRSLLSPGEVRRKLSNSPFGTNGFFAIGFTVRYVDSAGNTQTLQVPAHAATRPSLLRPGVVGYSQRINTLGSRAPACATACTVTAVDVQGRTHRTPLRLTSMSFAGQQLIPVPPDGMSLRPDKAVELSPAGKGLDVVLRDPYSGHSLLRWQRGGVPAALTTPGLRLERSHGQPLAYGVDGESRQVRVAGEVPALPILGRSGLLLDLGSALRGAGGQIPETETVVVARRDTPQSVLAKLRATGVVGRRQTVEQTLAVLRRTGTAQGTVLYSLVAVFGLLTAAVTVLSAVAEQRRERRREAAALRLVGVSRGAVAAGYRGEAEALGIAVLVVAGLTVWAGCRALLGVLPLVSPGQFGLPFDATPRLSLVLAFAAGSGMLVTLIVFLGLRQVGRSSPASLLRKEG
jgi:FtsX-like permease family protein